MTENEFRDALKRTVGRTGLSSERQQQVLARIKGERWKMRMSGKMRITLAVIMMLTLGMTAAVASSLGGVDWNGNPVQPQEHESLADTEQGARMIELFAEPGYGTIQTLVSPRQTIDQNGVLNGLTTDFFSESVEEMKAWVEGDGTLPWPAKLPEGYTMKLGRVGYSCGVSGGLRLISEEKEDDGYLRFTYELPPENRFLSNYFMNLENERGDTLVIHVQMEIGEFLNYTFYAGDDSKVTILDVEGASNALFIDSPAQLKLALRRPLEAMKTSYHMDYLDYYIMGQPMERTESFENMVIVINATDLGENDLLDIFGFTVK